MPDRHAHPDPGYLIDLARRDPIEYRQYVRNWRNACVNAKAATLVLLVWRLVKRPFEAPPHTTPAETPSNPSSSHTTQHARG